MYICYVHGINSFSMFRFILIIMFISVTSSDCYECSANQKECEVWLNIEEKLTMTWSKTRVYADKGKLYKFNEFPNNATTQIPLDEVITMDGYMRAVIAVNNSIPGPPIIAYEHQTLIVHVKNHLLSESITIHWHGLHQRGTSYMDGVAYITQCPINPGQKFTYKFSAYPSGTFWYHSHIGGQRVDGLFGALIIKPRDPQATNDVQDMIMHVGDWFHVTGATLHTKMIYGNFKSQPGFRQPKTLDGVYFAPLTFESAHIEGRGRYKDNEKGTWIEAPYKVYNVESGKKYRFRVIGSGTIYPFRVSIDGHVLTVVSSDGFEVQPREFESLIINPGERYDFIITANQPATDYWIRVDGMEVDFTDHNARGILRYNLSSTSEPTSQRLPCTQSSPCEVLNCQFSYYPQQLNTTCFSIHQLKANGGEKVAALGNAPVEMFQNWVAMAGGMGINGKLFEHPGVSSLTQPEEVPIELNCQKAGCAEGTVCKCQHELTLPYNKTIQMIWTNHGAGATRHHPIHIHGHSFHVLKIGYATYNNITGEKLSDNADIDCPPNQLCTHPSWKDKSWVLNDQISGLNLVDPPQKDTLMLPVGAYAIVRFRSDNPGKWFLHCHIEFHSMQGMALILNEAMERHLPPPPGFPICQEFHHDVTKDYGYIRADKVPEATSDRKERNLFLTLTILFAIVITLQMIAFVVYCCYVKRSGDEEGQKVSYDSKSGNVRT